jgi:hypothetical protein
MNDDRERNDNNFSHKDFEDRLRYVGKNVGNKSDRALAELLYGNYPNLNHKEFAICRTIADTLWDFEGHTTYLEVLERAKHNLAALFEDADEIEAVINRLIQNKIVKLQTIYTWYGRREGWDLRPDKVLKLREDIEQEIYEIIGKEFEAAVRESFFALRGMRMEMKNKGGNIRTSEL